MISSSQLSDRIAEAGDRLTPTEKRIAHLLSEDSTVIAFGTVAEVAERLATSGPTVVRFATKLGFDGYPQLQDEVRRTVAEQLKRPADRIRQPGTTTWDQSRSSAVGAVASIFDSVTPERIESMATAIATTSGRVWIVGSEGSAAAGVLAAGLHQIRPGVTMLSGSRATAASQLTDAGPDDTVVAIDFSRYEVAVVEAARFFSDLGARVLAITDGPFSPLASLADDWCEITVPAAGPFDSALPAIALVELIVNEAARARPQRAKERIDRTETISETSRVNVTD